MITKLSFSACVVVFAVSLSTHPISFSVNSDPSTMIVNAGTASLAAINDASQITAGVSHACLVTHSGRVACWGYNSRWQVGIRGDITNYYQTLPTFINSLSGITAVSAGNEHTCALTLVGGVKCWGDNLYGQLGISGLQISATPIDVTSLSTGVVAIATGYTHSCALTTSGGVKCWGNNRYGQLGDGSLDTRYYPVQVSGLSSGIRAIAVGGDQTCALTNTGSVKCWGVDIYYDLFGENFQARPLPQDVIGLETGVKSIALGRLSCGVMESNAVKCWGFNEVPTTNYVRYPKEVAALAGLHSLNMGNTHACGLDANNQPVCWGKNTLGQLGSGTQTDSDTPVKVVSLGTDVLQLAAGFNFSCALINTSGVKCWGDNKLGQLGDGTPYFRALPTDITALGGDIAKIAIGANSTCSVTQTGNAYCWGSNIDGTLGDGSTLDRGSPVAVSGLANNVREIALGHRHSCAVTLDSQVVCWGGNTDGQLGISQPGLFTTPQAVADIHDAQQISLGAYFSCILTTSGGVKCWGQNNSKQLGTDTGSRSTPEYVSGLLNNAVAIGAGYEHACALLVTHEVLCWGSNVYGELGNTGADLYSSTPVKVSGLQSSAVALAVGGRHSCIITNQGSVKCWGENANGELGDGTNISRKTPVDVVNLGASVKRLALGDIYTCALTSEGIYCWGDNSAGELGDGTTTSRNYPQKVVGLNNNIPGIYSGNGGHSCALISSNIVKCWGVNSNGQLGDGSRWRLIPTDIKIQDVDSDGDGLPDDIEINGFDDGTIHVDLPAMGARWDHKDVFVHIDWFESSGLSENGHTHNPSLDPAFVSQLRQAFAQAPVNNPDKQNGINLHIEFGTAIAEGDANRVLGTAVGDCDYNWKPFQDLKAALLPRAELQIFHYVIFAHELPYLPCLNGSPTGISRNDATTNRAFSAGASDYVVAVGGIELSNQFNDLGNSHVRIATFMHELGHNLGLGHGGLDVDSNGSVIGANHVNGKPNHLSVMNYSFSFTGLRHRTPGGQFGYNLFDYSRFDPVQLPALDETDLNEAFGPATDLVLSNYGSVYFCNRLSRWEEVDDLTQPVNWNCNSTFNEPHVQADINNDQNKTQLTTVNEWKNLRFSGGAIGDFGNIFEQPIQTSLSTSHEPTVEDVYRSMPVEFRRPVYIPIIMR